MGAEGSKGSSTAAPPRRTPWLLEEELAAIDEHIKKTAYEKDMWDATKLQSCVENGEKLSNLYRSLLGKWPHRSSGKEQPVITKFPVTQLLNIVKEILNPDPSVQAEALALMADTSAGGVMSTSLIEVVAEMINCYCSLQTVGPNVACNSKDDRSGSRVAQEWLHALVFGDVSHKKTMGSEVPSSVITREALEKWVQGHSALYTVVQLTLLRALVLPSLSPAADLFPEVLDFATTPVPLTKAELLLLNTALPQQLRCQWRLLFSNYIHGNSFSLLMKQIVGKGPSVVIVEDEKGNKFGGFAPASWEVRPQFHGTAESFLFSLSPHAGVYRTTGYNSNFQYLNYLEKNTMPNGLGMGGREELFGFFLSSDFGECTVAPSCTTYTSPPLCPDASPRVKLLTVWGVGEEPRDSDDDSDEENRGKKSSALDRNPEAKAMLDMIGRTRASEGLREPEQQ